MKRERGFALLAVLLVLALLTAIGAEFAYSMRLEAAAVRGYKAAVISGYLAEAGLEQAVREIVGQSQWVTLDADGELTFYRADRRPLARLPRSRVKLGGGEFSYRITDEEGRLNLNTTSPDRVARLLTVLGVDRQERDIVGDSLQDWRDANEEHRLNGAESDYYLNLARPYRSKNGNLDSVRELLQIRGVTPALFNGTGGNPGLQDLTTVKTTGQININTAPPQVLAALGLSDAEISEIVQSRRQGPYTQQQLSRFAGRGLATTSRTFRIEAEGWVDGKLGARLGAIVQKQAAGAGETLAVLESSGLR